MITCKEEFYKLYVDVNEAEVFSEYCKIANQLGITFYNKEPADLAVKKGYRFISSDIPVQKGNLFWCDEIGMKERHGKVKAKLSDLKPRTKVEYEKVTDPFFDLKDDFENGNLFFKADTDGEYHRVSAIKVLGLNFDKSNLYRKVERPVEWWEDAASHMANIHNTASVYNEEKDTLAVHASMTRDQWCDFARILLEQEGE